MLRVLTSLVILVFISGCATTHDPTPENYLGATVMVDDSCTEDGGGKGKFFVLDAVEGKAIRTSLMASSSASQGRGFTLSIFCIGRRLPVTPVKVRLVGTHMTAAPIHAMASKAAGTFFTVEGTVDFKPVAEVAYRVRGELSKEGSCVWIEESQSGRVVTERVCGK